MTENKEAPSALSEISTKLDAVSLPEEKLQILITFMEAKISTSSHPQFKPFWEAREKCLELFKDVENPLVRSQLWAKYSELSKEARRLKELLDEESAFNVEQIDLAIKALEEEISNLNDTLEGSHDIDLPRVDAIGRNFRFYSDVQKELNFLNAYASRIHALRKELIKTEMRIKIKNKFFDRLSTLGDLLFPRRKELIDIISKQFEEDVNAFIEKHNVAGGSDSPFALKDEIKGLQGIAKILTLSTHAFKESRLKLSEFWDNLKVREKEHKKERAELKEQFKQNCDELSLKLDEIKAKYAAKELSGHSLDAELDQFVKTMRDVQLGRDEVKFLREKLNQFNDELDQERQKESEERAKQDQIREQERKERLLNFKNRVLALLTEASNLDIADIIEKRDALVQEIGASNLNRNEKQELEKEFKPFKELIADKEEAKLLALSKDDRDAIGSLKEVLKQRKARRQEIKDKIDELRKKAGTSGLDFSKAISLNEQISEEKEKLDKLTDGIKEIEEKLNTFK